MTVWRTPCLCLLIFAGGFFASAEDSDSEVKPLELNRTLALVDNEPITWVDLTQRGGKLEDLIRRKLIFKAFKQLNIKIEDHHIDKAVENFVQRNYQGNRDKFLVDIQRQGITFDRFKEIQEEQIALHALEPVYFSEKDKAITKEDKDSVYEKMRSDLAKEETVRLQVINIAKNIRFHDGAKPEAVAKALHDEISSQPAEKRKAKFAEVAARPGNAKGDPLAPDDGEMIGPDGRDLRPDSLAPKVRRAVSKLKPNELAPVFDDGLMWKIVLLNSRTIPSPPPRAEIEDKLQKLALEQKRKTRQDVFLRMVRNSSEVKIFE